MIVSSVSSHKRTIDGTCLGNWHIAGLVESLGYTLQALQDFASRFASEKFRSNVKEAEIAISSSHSDLMII